MSTLIMRDNDTVGMYNSVINPLIPSDAYMRQ